MLKENHSIQGVSIIICFYNAGDKLGPTLEHIKVQEKRSAQNTELILVNNCSSDHSEKVIMDTMKDFHGFPWKIVAESKPGLANARLCGLHHAQYEFLLFCDDDNWLAPDYVQSGEDFLSAHSEVGILGGQGFATSMIAIPDWFEAVQNYYAVGPQLSKSGQVKGTRNMVYGAGMFIRKQSFEHLLACGFTFQSLGRTGTNLSAGEDSELCLAVQISGKQIYYLENLHFKHFMEPFRLDKQYLRRMQIGMSNSGFYGRFYRDYLFGYRPRITRYFWQKEVIYTLKDLLKHWLKLNFHTQRQLKLIQFIWKEQNQYTKTVQQILNTCEQLVQRS
jgi:glycosyltransferase involved in cell wall biosynthesis